MSSPIATIPFLLHLGCGLTWWLCLLSLNWRQQTEIIYLITFLVPFFTLYTLWIAIPLLSIYLRKAWLKTCLIWVDVVTLLTFIIYALSWSFFRSFVLAYLSINAGNRYSSWGLPIALMLAVSCLIGIWMLKHNSPDTRTSWCPSLHNTQEVEYNADVLFSSSDLHPIYSFSCPSQKRYPSPWSHSWFFWP